VITVVRPGRGLVFGGVLAIVGGVVAIVGTLLPWEQIDAGAAAAVPARSAMGIEWDDGKIFVFVAILTIVASGCWLAAGRLPSGVVGQVERLLGTGSALAVLTGGYVVIFGFLNLRDISAQVDQLNASVRGAASVGPGIYMDLVAGAMMLAGATVGLVAARLAFGAPDSEA
jgi:hypothetical protein